MSDSLPSKDVVAPRPWRLWKVGERSEIPHIADANGRVIARAEGNIWTWQEFIAPVILAAVNGATDETGAWRSQKAEPIPDDVFAFKWGDWWIELPPLPGAELKASIETNLVPAAAESIGPTSYHSVGPSKAGTTAAVETCACPPNCQGPDNTDKLCRAETFVQSQAASDVVAERRRQVSGEGWTPEHDDAHSNFELSAAAVSYALRAPLPHDQGDLGVPMQWPWSQEWWKPTDPRRDLVKAGALILAEIERLDRGELKANEGQS